MKALLIGCNGLLGQNLVCTAPLGISLYGCSIEPECFVKQVREYITLDIGKKRDLQQVIAKTAPDLIINAAAMTDVDLCEKEVDLCRLLNRDAVGWMAEMGNPMVHISTDYVFDGTSGPYREDDQPNPLGVYGQVKLESEPLVLKACNRSLVIRTMTLWGQGHRLRPSFVDFIKNSLLEGRSIKIVTDQTGNPTLAEDLAIAIWKLVQGSFSGIYHVSGSELLSRYDWAIKTADFFGLNKNFINPCSTQELNQAAERPLNSGLILDKLIRDTGFVPRNITQQLQAVSWQQ